MTVQRIKFSVLVDIAMQVIVIRQHHILVTQLLLSKDVEN